MRIVFTRPKRFGFSSSGVVGRAVLVGASFFLDAARSFCFNLCLVFPSVPDVLEVAYVSFLLNEAGISTNTVGGFTSFLVGFWVDEMATNGCFLGCRCF